MIGQACKCCGEPLRDHRDGRCDPVAAKRKRRRDVAQAERDMLASLGMTRARGNLGTKFYE